ncbi:IclR family transcriptional regulator C-terminal domain-containing protein [Streptosporangium sp. NPDC002721]|uniref:IclR family transcriptional regulator domain-containing protein n=1 Tax=Streptosporangium sp. NPDC002721 TaxID=3366188 RepID=UPI0036B81592
MDHEPVRVADRGPARRADRDAERQQRRVERHQGFARYTDTTITTRAGLETELDRIRARGTAVNFEERVPGVRAVAVPVHDGHGNVLAALAIQGPAVRPKGGQGTPRGPGRRDRLQDIDAHTIWTGS